MTPSDPDSPKPRVRRPIDAMRVVAPAVAVRAFQAEAGPADNPRMALDPFVEIPGDLPPQA